MLSSFIGIIAAGHVYCCLLILFIVLCKQKKFFFFFLSSKNINYLFIKKYYSVIKI